ncbi:lysine exporter LysO family protein [Raoultibacter massiliensis]|uniref:lysine exporter LysO family protein n=1 Tax=Raoultibacter massiliensis TaxID=1852371 RepID=UPI003A95A8B7
MEVLIIMCVGVAVGATVFPDRWRKANENIALGCTTLLIFSMGSLLGGRDAFLDELATIGIASLAFCLIPVIFSTVIVYFLTSRFMADITKRHAEDAHRRASEKGEKNNAEAIMIILAVCALAAGTLYGLSHAGIAPLDALSEHSDFILYALMFFVGISVGSSRGLLTKLREYHVRALIVPFGIVVGSLLGGLACALLLGMPLAVGGAIASGLGWYSLCGVMISGFAGASAGSIAFLSSLLREIVSLFTIPWIARHLNYPTCIAPAAATSEDTTLPMLSRSTNSETVVLAVANGVICSALVPVLIEAFHAMM